MTRPCAAKERTDTGKLAYEDEQGFTRVCTFLLDQVPPLLLCCANLVSR